MVTIKELVDLICAASDRDLPKVGVYEGLIVGPERLSKCYRLNRWPGRARRTNMTHVDTIHFRVIKTTGATGAPAYVVQTSAASNYTGRTLTPDFPTPDEAIRWFEYRLAQALGTLTPFHQENPS